MKVDIEKTRLAVAVLSEQVYITIPSKNGKFMKHRHDLTSDFLRCIVDYGAGKRFDIAGADGVAPTFEVCVLEKKGFKKVLYSRNDVLKLLAKFVKDEGGEKINVEQWAKNNLK